MHDHLKVKKAALLSIAINVLEIIAGVVMMLLVRKMLLGGVEESIVRMVSLMCFTIVGWGALTDIGASLTSLRMVRRTQELEEAYVQLEDLNREMRAQRHDFMNHIQVVYSLIEMNEPGEAMAYMDKIYGDMQRVSRMMRTACPAVNALIQAKVVEASQRGAELKLSIAAKWDDPLMPAWEICRVLANLIDNALDAATGAELPAGEKPTVELVLGEDLRSWFFSVRNNGPAIPEKARVKIFEPGFTTKKKGQGMGLFIVNQTVTEMGGRQHHLFSGSHVLCGRQPDARQSRRSRLQRAPRGHDRHARPAFQVFHHLRHAHCAQPVLADGARQHAGGCASG